MTLFVSLLKKHHCAALFTDLSKAYDTIHHMVISNSDSFNQDSTSTQSFDLQIISEIG